MEKIWDYLMQVFVYFSILGNAFRLLLVMLFLLAADEKKKAESDNVNKDLSQKVQGDDKRGLSGSTSCSSSSTLPCMDRLREELSCVVSTLSMTLNSIIDLIIPILITYTYSIDCSIDKYAWKSVLSRAPRLVVTGRTEICDTKVSRFLIFENKKHI